jgi:hypothetical protein
LAARRPDLPALVLCGVLALAFLRLWRFVLGADFMASVQAIDGVMSGHPHWIIYQSRLAGPSIVKFASSVFSIRLETAYQAYIVLTMTAGGFLTFRFSRVLSGRDEIAFAAMLLFFVLAFCVIGNDFIYPWDFLDILFFTLFIFFVATEKPYWWFLLLFGAAVLNRESAFFIAPWLVLQPFIGGRYAVAKWRNCLAGLALVCLGAAFVLTVRYMLLIDEVAPPETGQPYGRHFQWVYRENWHVIFLRLKYPFSTNVVPALFWIASYFVAALVALRDPRKFGLMSLCFVILLSGVLVFGVMMESRILLEFVPLLTLGSLIASGAYRRSAQLGEEC